MARRRALAILFPAVFPTILGLGIILLSGSGWPFNVSAAALALVAAIFLPQYLRRRAAVRRLVP